MPVLACIRLLERFKQGRDIFFGYTHSGVGYGYQMQITLICYDGINGTKRRGRFVINELGGFLGTLGHRHGHIHNGDHGSGPSDRCSA
jgi:hypothetical protein